MTEQTTQNGNLPQTASNGMGIPFGPIPAEPALEAIDGLRFDFCDGARIKFPKDAKAYRVRFVDLDNMVTLYDGIVPPGGDVYASSQKKFFVRWRVILSKPEDDELLFSHDYNAEGKPNSVKESV